MSEDIQYMDVAEFRRLGYLQEANRQFFHPLGLALSVKVHDDGTEEFGPIWDGRDDPEGWNFGSGMLDLAKAQIIGREQLALSNTRQKALGYVIQPVEEPE